MCFAFSGNLSGLPAISFPLGYDENKMPAVMQAMRRHWGEHILLRIAYSVEQPMDRKKPDLYFSIFEQHELCYLEYQSKFKFLINAESYETIENPASSAAKFP
jgi:hypothetical protein